MRLRVKITRSRPIREQRFVSSASDWFILTTMFTYHVETVRETRGLDIIGHHGELCGALVPLVEIRSLQLHDLYHVVPVS